MRFQAEIPAKDAAILNSLMEECEVHSNAELLTNILYLASWAVSERSRGCRIASISDHGPVRELVSPMLERVAPKGELPQVEMDWTAKELRSLAALASTVPAPPAEPLVRLMTRR